MELKLSFTDRDYYEKTPFPILLTGIDAPISGCEVCWRVIGEAYIRTFRENKSGLALGALVTPTGSGRLTVFAEYCGESCSAELTVRAAEVTEAAELNYYLADLHAHTTMNHDPVSYLASGEDTQARYVDYMVNEGGLDLSVISDHGDVIEDWAFFRGFLAAERAEGSGVVILPGSESEISPIEYDRFGVKHKNAGEIVILNADNYTAVDSFPEFFERLETSPYAVCTLAHPQVVGSGSGGTGVWNFSLDKHREDGFDKYIKLVEMGNGTLRASNIINEFVYSLALDSGFRVSTTCSADQHEIPWGKAGMPGRTVVMAPDGSRQALLNALATNNCYSTDSGNVKLRASVNGKPLPADLAPADSYNFHVEISYFEDMPDTEIALLRVISDGGRTLAEIDCRGRAELDFEILAPTARWFYLRLTDGEHRKTLSPPAYTGRACDPVERRSFVPMDKSGMTAVDLVSGKDASAVINGDPLKFYESEKGRADIVIDLGSLREVSALGHYPRSVLGWQARREAELFATYVCEYEVSASVDGAVFERVAEGLVRSYGGELVIPFEKRAAKYLRFTARSNVGDYLRYEKFKNFPISIAELSPGNME